MTRADRLSAYLADLPPAERATVVVDQIDAASPHELEQYLAAVLERARDLETSHAPAIARITSALVAHLRSWKPESVSPLGTLPAPTEAIRDPRSTP